MNALQWGSRGLRNKFKVSSGEAKKNQAVDEEGNKLQTKKWNGKTKEKKAALKLTKAVNNRPGEEANLKQKDEDLRKKVNTLVEEDDRVLDAIGYSMRCIEEMLTTDHLDIILPSENYR
jgi:hypothetical protein